MQAAPIAVDSPLRDRCLLAIGIMLLSAGCGDDNKDGITFTTQGYPTLFDARLDDGEWRTYEPKFVMDGNATYNVATFWSTIDAVFVCERDDGSFAATEIRTTSSKDLSAACESAIPREQLVVTIHSAIPPAYVDVYDTNEETAQGDAQFSFQAPIPAADVLAYDTERFAILRGVDTGDGLGEIAIDMASEPPIRIGQYTFDSPDSDETTSTLCSYSTGESIAVFSLIAAGGYALPDDTLVADGDTSFVELDASSPKSYRTVSVTNPDPSVPFAMHWLPRITGTTDPMRTAATIDPIEFDFDTAFVICSAANGSESLSITHSYQDVQADALAINESVPGWRWALGVDQRECNAGVGRRIEAQVLAQTSFY